MKALPREQAKALPKALALALPREQAKALLKGLVLAPPREQAKALLKGLVLAPQKATMMAQALGGLLEKLRARPVPSSEEQSARLMAPLEETSAQESE
jgi:hypothetical protein